MAMDKMAGLKKFYRIIADDERNTAVLEMALLPDTVTQFSTTRCAKVF